jgi:hypothetical protein
LKNLSFDESPQV